MKLKCAFCYFGPDDKESVIEFIIDGQGVCMEHVDDADGSFGPALRALHREKNKK